MRVLGLLGLAIFIVSCNFNIFQFQKVPIVHTWYKKLHICIFLKVRDSNVCRTQREWTVTRTEMQPRNDVWSEVASGVTLISLTVPFQLVIYPGITDTPWSESPSTPQTVPGN
jgi:hypothetical protein